MLGGQISMVFDGLSVPLPLIKSGKLKALAISGAARVSSLPALPTFGEAGLDAFDMAFWTGVFAPDGTPQAVIGTINRESNAALKAPDIVQSLVDTGGAALAVLRGNLCPTGAVIKPSAANPKFFCHRGPALVFDSNAEMLAKIHDPALDVDENTVIVLRNAEIGRAHV